LHHPDLQKSGIVAPKVLDDEEASDGAQWDFKVVASVKSHNRNLTSTDVIGTIAFDRKNEVFATGGIARKIRVYSYETLTTGLASLDDDDEDDEEEQYYRQRRVRKRTNDIDHARCCVHEVCTPAKLSSLQWHTERPNLIACGDYDGVVAEWDVERTCAVSERDENGGSRIWSIDYSNDFPDLIASASDDGTVRMWDRNSEQSVATLTPPSYSSICCAEFGPASSSLIALASADTNVYLYDTRWLAVPLLTLSHHKRAASYVRFLNRTSLVSSSIDSSVKLWDISKPRDSSPRQPVKSFDSHYNVRNFTGLSVRSEGGLLACGSETNQAFVYDSQMSTPAFTHSFDYKLGLGLGAHSNPNLGLCGSAPNGSSSSHSVEPPEGSLIVSAVCWRPEPNDCTLVAANSDGVLRILSGSRR
jgi:E3 ubiquitin-protein ligase RFWD2